MTPSASPASSPSPEITAAPTPTQSPSPESTAVSGLIGLRVVERGSSQNLLETIVAGVAGFFFGG
jgi:hypothetical protein